MCNSFGYIHLHRCLSHRFHGIHHRRIISSTQYCCSTLRALICHGSDRTVRNYIVTVVQTLSNCLTVHACYVHDTFVWRCTEKTGIKPVCARKKAELKRENCFCLGLNAIFCFVYQLSLISNSVVFRRPFRSVRDTGCYLSRSLYA